MIAKMPRQEKNSKTLLLLLHISGFWLYITHGYLGLAVRQVYKSIWQIRQHNSEK
jgi:hypothetical protein